MAISNPSITLELDHYAIATGTSVTLTVRLSEKFQDLQDEGVRLEFNDGPGPGGKFEGLHPDGKVVTITWRAPNLGNGKKFVLTAKLRKAGTDLDTDAKEVSVLRNPSIEIDSIEPDKTPEGGFIRLKTSVRNQTPATLRDLNVKVSWPDTRNGVFTSDAANPLLVTWDTTGLAPGTYPPGLSWWIAPTTLYATMTEKLSRPRPTPRCRCVRFPRRCAARHAQAFDRVAHG